MSIILKESVVFRSQTLNPWTGFYFLQSMLINFALGYEFSLLYAAIFTCALLVLWRHAPRAQKVLIGVTTLVAASYFPFGQAYGAPNFNTLLALTSTNMEESTEILTIFPWYHYAIGLFIFAMGVVSLRRRVTTPSTPWHKWDPIGTVICLAA